MKKFLIKISFFLFPVVIFILLIFVLSANIPNNYSFKKKYLDKNSNNIETLILGSSHTFGGVNPEYFSSNTFNAAMSGQLLYYDFKIFNKYKKNLKQLKTIIIPISFPTFWVSHKIEELGNKGKYVTYGFYESKAEFYYWKLLGNKPNFNPRQVLDYYLRGISIKNSNSLGWSRSFAFSNRKNFEITSEKTLSWQTIDNLDSKDAQKSFKENLFFLNSIIDFCKRNNIKVLLLSTPLTEVFLEKANKKQLRRTIEIAKDLANRHENCFYLNLFRSNSFSERDFWDSSHLSNFGARKLSFIVNNFLRNNNTINN